MERGRQVGGGNTNGGMALLRMSDLMSSVTGTPRVCNLGVLGSTSLPADGAGCVAFHEPSRGGLIDSERVFTVDSAVAVVSWGSAKVEGR